MKVVILAGGLGTRLSEETAVRPKPMVEIGSKPMLWHIMKIYSAYGFHDFVICCGYKGYVIKEYFANYVLHGSDVTFDLKTGIAHLHHSDVEPWTVTLVETGETTNTGGRVARIEPYLDDDLFAMTYGDAVGNVDISGLLEFHQAQGTKATVTAVRPPARFGALDTDGLRVTRFKEKPTGGDAWINGGFFILSRDVLGYIDGDDTVWEHEPIERLAREGQLSAYHHDGFWQAMDTLRDRTTLDELWTSGNAPWKVW
ncbi:MAG TPA: glucose-1-phosphate cytidylyltransferase [Acidimicrobiales bacterium]|nr:glucose-1-phosphate cytidylyltransferase [Acidimicrobiales bacterium]